MTSSSMILTKEIQTYSAFTARSGCSGVLWHTDSTDGLFRLLIYRRACDEAHAHYRVELGIGSQNLRIETFKLNK